MEEDTPTIAAIAAASADFSVLVAALDAAELTAALDDPDDDLTVFAPTNAAFAALAADLGFTGEATDPDEVFTFVAGALDGLDPEGDGTAILTDILLYHVSPGTQTAAEIAAAETVPTLLEGAAITPAEGRLVDLEPDYLDPEIAVADIDAANGKIQAIDRVLLPLDIPGNDRPSILDIAAGTEGFAVLTAALEATGLDAVLGDPDIEVTVFAPTDAAFAALAARLGYEGDPTDTEAVFDAIAGVLTDLSPDGDPLPLLSDILLYHVSPGAQTAAELGAAESVATSLDGARVVLSEAGTIFDADPEAPDAALAEGLTDIVASNGLVQAVDGVLLPLDLADPAPDDTIADIVAASGEGFDEEAGDFDILLAALQTAELDTALASPDDSFTVFAPTDAAFQDLATALGQDGSTEQAAFDGIVTALTGLAGDEDGAVALLSSILLYHVADGRFTRADLAASPELSSLLGEGPEADGAGLTDVDRGFEDPAFLDAASDIVAANGLVQAIDAVLLPINVPDATDLLGDAEDNRLEVGPDTLVVDGGGGTDTAVFDAPLAAASFAPIAGGFEVTTDGAPVEALNIERFEFADATLVADTGELAAQVLRLYGVGLGREPDIPGVSFWTEVAEAAGIGIVADAFVEAPEFLAQFEGLDPESREIVEAFYENFLGREADEAGVDFWTAAVESEGFDTSDLLVAFADSLEYRDLTEGLTDDGVLLLV